MSTHTASGRRRKLHDDVSDISTSHNKVAPFEICTNALGLRQFLVSGYLFDNQSFTSLYDKGLKNGWDKIFIGERNRMKPNENSVVKCFLLNRLLHQYNQDTNGFNQQIENLRLEIDSRMVYTFPNWKPQDLFREIQRWRDIQRRRRLFYFSYEGEQTPDLPSFLMLQKATTNWCQHLITYCRQNKNYWNCGGRNQFIELLEHSFIIVTQPTGPDEVPVTDYTKDTKHSSGKYAKLNVRIICLLNPDVLQGDVELSNTGVMLCPLVQSTNNIGLKQTPIVWQTEYVMTTDSGPIPIQYTEIHNLVLNNLYSRRKTDLPDLNLYQLIFQTPVKVTFDLSDKSNPVFEHNIELISQPFGISCHSKFFPDVIAAVFLHELDQILKNERKNIDPDILTEYTCRYQTRMLGVKTKEHTTQFIKEVFTKAFDDDVKNKNADEPLKLLVVKQRLAQLISQIKCMVDYPVLAMMYDDSLFLGICNSSEVDRMLMGTPQQPQMLLRFEDLLRHEWDERPEIRCNIHDGTFQKTTFSKKAFIDDMCRFIYESAEDIARQTAMFSYSEQRVLHDFQWYYNQAIPVLSKILPTNKSDYKPLIPVLWLSRTRSQHHVDGNSQSQSNRLPTESPHSSASNLTNDPLTVTCTVNQQDLQNNSTAITFDIEMPVGVNIDPDVIVQYLKQKFEELCTIQNPNIPQTHSIHSLQETTCAPDVTDTNINEETYDLSLRTPILQTDSECEISDDNIPPS